MDKKLDSGGISPEESQKLTGEARSTSEELQSTKEEVITVNNELQARNVLLGQSREFAISIVETVRQPLLVLDMEFRIKVANRAFYQKFQVSPVGAEGKVLYALSHGQWDTPGLRDLLDGLAMGGLSFPD